MLALWLAIVLAGTGAGCGSTGGQTAGETASSAGSSAAQKEDAEQAESLAQEQTESNEVISMGRYIETEIALPEGAAVVGRSWNFLEDGKLAYFDAEAGLYQADEPGAAWEKIRGSQDFAAAGEGYVSHSAIAPDGSVAFCLVQFEGEEMKTKLCCLDPEGNLKETDESPGEGDWFDKVAFGPDSALYASSIKGQVCRVDKETMEIRQLFLAAERPEMMAFTGKLLLALENDGVELYDLEQGFLTDPDAVLNDFCVENVSGRLGNMSDCVGGCLVGGEEGCVYLAFSKGVYRHVLGGTVMEQVIDGDFSTFGDPSKGICSLLLNPEGEFLLLTTGEGGVRLTYDPDEPSVPENLLTVYCLQEDYGSMRQVISMFQNEHPDVQVRYEIGIPRDSAVTLTDALKNLNVELMSGKGPDVLMLDGLEYSVYAQKGQLLDLSDILEGLAGEDAVFEKIAGSYRTQEGTFAIPAAFSVPLICGKTEDVEKVTDLASFADLVESKKGDTQGLPVTGSVTPAQVLKRLMPVCSPAWLAETELNTEALEEFLGQAKRIYDADIAATSAEAVESISSYRPNYDLGNSTTEMQVGIAQISCGLAEYMLGDIGGVAHFTENEEGYSFDLWRGQAGCGFVPGYICSVTAGSGQPELAKEFVRTMLSNKIQSSAFDTKFPVNRAAFDKKCEWSEVSSGGCVFMPDGEERKFHNEYPGEETIGRLKDLIEQLEVRLEGNGVLEEAVMKYGEEVLRGRISPEEGTQSIAHEVAIYLAERR